jgi:hypothetical protein
MTYFKMSKKAKTLVFFFEKKRRIYNQRANISIYFGHI